jgi:hypothetical protein
MFFVMYLIKQWNSQWNSDLDSDTLSSTRLEYQITKTWNDEQLDHNPVKINLHSHNDAGIKVIVEAPFFNDMPHPGGTPGESFDGLWDFEGDAPIFPYSGQNVIYPVYWYMYSHTIYVCDFILLNCHFFNYFTHML